MDVQVKAHLFNRAQPKRGPIAMANNKATKNSKKEEEKLPKKSIADLLKQLALATSASSEDDTEEQKPKPMSEYKFWKTQPVTKFNEAVSEEGPIDRREDVSRVPKEPYAILDLFEWSDLDIEDDSEMSELYELLYEHYVEDHDSTFRFAYGKAFFNWALKTPGWKKQWHLGVRVKKTKKLVAFISAVPATLRVRGNTFKAVEINFLCVHKQLRNKRLAPLLIKEITRRVHLENVWQALYTSGTLLPSPISTCRYAHRPLNWEKLCDVGFSALPLGKTRAQMVAKYALPSITKCTGLRRMEVRDVDAVHSLFTRFQKRYQLTQLFTKEELTHLLLGDDEEQEKPDGEKVIVTYVVENTEKKITDFFSFYVLPFTVLNNSVYKSLGVGYLYYYATETGLDKPRYDAQATNELKKRLENLISDALVLAKGIGMDVFNAMTSQDNVLFLEDLKFGPGDGFLNYYLFNYKAFPVGGGFDSQTREYELEKRSDVGVVML
ncbi:hypothetical protein HII13_003635 [Brettanomyces bruxellensis]|uniref:Glycylpeptide N-tetradecanoyltransferase n=1 Tax=Dekkera bruxellensis TaxID=5007 RepID=A0A3F2Y4Z1_DEKBR|nr:hypothetical protein HII13_003635 [Brettanomyces bruxellensis]VUG18521.1 NMT1 [Brettanomyces bruxellensis]